MSINIIYFFNFSICRTNNELKKVNKNTNENFDKPPISGRALIAG